MTANVNRFDTFLTTIRPTTDQVQDFVDAHTRLRSRFKEVDSVKEIHVGDFLQGSYRRHTAIKPVEGKKSDVDVVIVTNLSKDDTIVSALKRRFIDFLNQYDDYRGSIDDSKSHAIGLTVGEVEMDLVITLAPSQAIEQAVEYESDVTSRAIAPNDDFWSSLGGDAWTIARGSSDDSWKREPLVIPDFRTSEWDESDPLTQISWSEDHNRACNGHFVNVVKALKWWKREIIPTPKHPKSFPLEHLIGEYCRIGIDSIAEGVWTTLEAIATCPNLNAHLDNGTIPNFPDRGIRCKNVWHRIEFDDFEAFMDEVVPAASLAKTAFHEENSDNSACLWGELFGPQFPTPDDCSSREISRGGYVRPRSASCPSSGTFGG